MRRGEGEWIGELRVVEPEFESFGEALMGLFGLGLWDFH